MIKFPVLPLLHDDVDEGDCQGIGEKAGQKDEQNLHFKRLGKIKMLKEMVKISKSFQVFSTTLFQG